VHTLSQLVCPLSQSLPQTPPLQTWSLSQETSQLPQYEGFVSGSTQAPSQLTVSPPQVKLHSPASH